MSGKAVDNINVTADCGAKGVILPGKSTVHVDTEYVEGKRRCTGCNFVCNEGGTRATLDSSNHTSSSYCLENDAPLTR